MRIPVINRGYLSTVHAACIAKLGHGLVRIDVDEKKAQLPKWCAAGRTNEGWDAPST